MFCLTAEIDLGAKGEEIKNESFAKGSPTRGAVAAKPATERFDNRRGYFFYFLNRLSLLVAQKVPTVWKICTSSTSRMTQTIIMLVW